jgi:hypothetical protein
LTRPSWALLWPAEQTVPPPAHCPGRISWPWTTAPPSPRRRQVFIARPDQLTTEPTPRYATSTWTPRGGGGRLDGEGDVDVCGVLIDTVQPRRHRLRRHRQFAHRVAPGNTSPSQVTRELVVNAWVEAGVESYHSQSARRTPTTTSGRVRDDRTADCSTPGAADCSTPGPLRHGHARPSDAALPGIPRRCCAGHGPWVRPWGTT